MCRHVSQPPRCGHVFQLLQVLSGLPGTPGVVSSQRYFTCRHASQPPRCGHVFHLLHVQSGLPNTPGAVTSPRYSRCGDISQMRILWGQPEQAITSMTPYLLPNWQDQSPESNSKHCSQPEKLTHWILLIITDSWEKWWCTLQSSYLMPASKKRMQFNINWEGCICQCHTVASLNTLTSHFLSLLQPQTTKMHSNRSTTTSLLPLF